jgi:co-chaperonin GroES (HSP10)
MKILGNRILIQPTVVEKTDGGIFLPQTLDPDKQNQEGVVIAIGSAIRESLPYRKGSHVFIEIYKAKPVNVIIVNGLECYLVEQDAICGVEVNGKFHPVNDKILLKPIKTVSRDSNIIRPSAYEVDAADGLLHCTVHLLGNGVKNKKSEYRPFIVKIGDEVLIKPFSGRDVDAAECSYKLVKESDIEAIIEVPENQRWRADVFKLKS